MTGDDPKARFTPRVADYVSGRPAYPLEVIDVLRRRVGFDADWRVVDAGAGTGISTALFLGHGNATTAVEPNAAMRSAADERFAEDPNYDSVAAAAETTGLPDGSADLVVAAQAFHWFDPAAFARECRRLLTPRGRVLLMWNAFPPQASAAVAAYQAVVDRHAIDLARVAGKWRDGENAAVRWFTPDTFVRLDVPNPQTYDAERLFARLASSSYMPPREHPGFGPMRDALGVAFAAHAQDGLYTLPYVCELFLGVPAGPA